ncbi:LysR family transcriptional regulator [Methylobacterium symbioticum]|uniref:Nodulation protein D 2 n=1 Tax=Methylobacterium symbioticum TaxID=2584084 RepID=A0A509EC71_9HYPH|nr:LysR family transcriptional regulator [Methylobacterium symbioticum]VUD71772.1 Nodulation protein D 2 [Methylobacterium symbioticum]
MNLRSVDLNLLVALDALLTELHVTRASEKVGLSQPAMSNALSRLRHLFKDDLLVRTPTGMQATPRALELAEPTRQVLRQIERVLDHDTEFDPAVAQRTFTVRLSDLLGLILLPQLLEGLGKDAPGLHLDVVHLSPSKTVEGLERDEIDLAVSMGLSHSTALRSETLMEDRMVCALREDHPAASEPMGLDRFLAFAHLKVSMSPTDLRFVDDVLARDGLKRRLTLNVPHWLLVPHVLNRSDLISVMPQRLASALTAAGHRLAVRDLPFASEPFAWSLYWHRRHDRNPAIAWLRAELRSIASTLDQS